MGSFLGHILPGSLLLLLGLWWTWNIFKIHYKSKYITGKRFHSLLWYRVPFCKCFPFESATKVVLAIIGFIAEIMAEVEKGFQGIMNNTQHITMYAFFGLTGVIDLLKYYSKIPPDNIDRFWFVITFAIQGILLQNHVHGLKPMEIQVHILLYYLTISCAFSAFVEMIYQNNFIVSFSKTYFVTLQGTWLYQVGFMVYPPSGLFSWNFEDHEQMGYVSLIFTFHFGVAFFLMLALGYCAWAHVKNTEQLDDIKFDINAAESEIVAIPLKINGHCQKCNALLDSDNELI